MIVLLVLAALFVYAMIGRAIAAAALSAWWAGKPDAFAARFWFPITSRYEREKFGKYQSTGDTPASTIDRDKPGSVDAYHWGVTVVWPFRLLWSLVGALIALTGAMMWLFASKPVAKVPLVPEAESDDLTPEGRYLKADRRERELLAQLDAVRVQKSEAAIALGGEDEAKKLVALPERHL